MVKEYLNKSKLPNLNNCKIAILGLGYVGLPLAIAIANKKNCLLTKNKLKRKVIAYDINRKRVNDLNRGFDKNKIFSKKILTSSKSLKFTSDIDSLIDIDVFIVTVPTPINDQNEPDLSFLKDASKNIGNCIKSNKKNNPIIIFESTVYPGATEEICIPIIEKISSKKYNSNTQFASFYCGYSPERINPGDLNHKIESVVKVTSGCNKKVSTWIDKFYGSFINAGTFKVSNIKIAEAAKIIENTQRDINIALVNELAILFKKMNIDTKEVLNAANTKWNFQKYRPGLVGGHCIGVDPYYLTYKAKEIGYNAKLISAGRYINDYMHKYLFEQIILYIEKIKCKPENISVLVLGLSYKENCPDIRNSKLISLIYCMNKKNMKVSIFDPIVDKDEVRNKTGLKTLDSLPEKEKFPVIIFALDHKAFKKINAKKLNKLKSDKGIIFDLTNRLKNSKIINI